MVVDLYLVLPKSDRLSKLELITFKRSLEFNPWFSGGVMRKIRTRLLTTAAALAMTGAAYAGPPAPVAPVNNWTGFYGGVQFGFASMDGSCSQTDTVGFLGGALPCFFNPGFSSAGAIGGGRAGYDWQTGALVVGLVGDLNWTNLTWSPTFNTAVLEPGSAGHANLRLDSLASVRGRFGWAVNNWLVYGTAGVAWGRFAAESGLQGTCCGNWDASANTTRTGVVAGGGIEYKVTQHVSLFAEGLWYGNFGTVDNSRFCPATFTLQLNSCFASGTYTTSFKINDVVAGTVGLNLRF